MQKMLNLDSSSSFNKSIAAVKNICLERNEELKQRKHLLFVFGCPPRQGYGSPVIVDRHLKKLSDEWDITIVAPEQSFNNVVLPSHWKIVSIPMRRWWWLPYRSKMPSLMMALRFFYWRIECEKVLKRERPTAVLTVLHDMYSVFASYLSESWQVPLSVIIHDQDELFAKSEAGRRWIKDNWPKVIDQARRVWTVSPELADVYKVSGKKKTSTLFPIPGKSNNEFSSWQKTFEYAPVIGYAGNIYPSQVKYFRKIAAVLKKANGTLLLVTPKLDSSVQSLIDSFSNIEHHEPFSNNSDVVKFLKEKASCILICYTFTVSELPWTLTSFPSKLVEFSSLGLPMVILSPDTTALGKWAKTSAWRSCLHEFDEDKLLEIFNQLRKKQCWIDMATQTKNAAMTEFDADTIHFQFESELAVRR